MMGSTLPFTGLASPDGALAACADRPDHHWNEDSPTPLPLSHLRQNWHVRIIVDGTEPE